MCDRRSRLCVHLLKGEAIKMTVVKLIHSRLPFNLALNSVTSSDKDVQIQASASDCLTIN